MQTHGRPRAHVPRRRRRGRAALVALLARCGVDCRLELPPPPALGSSVGRTPSATRPRRSRSRRRASVTAGPDGTAGRLRLAAAVRRVRWRPERPALPFARPARPPLERVWRRLKPSYDCGMLTNGPLVARARGPHRRTARRRPRRGGQLVHLRPDARAAGPVGGRPGPVVLPSFTFSASAHAVALERPLAAVRRVRSRHVPDRPRPCRGVPRRRQRPPGHPRVRRAVRPRSPSRSWRRRPVCRSCSTPRTPSGATSNERPIGGVRRRRGVQPHAHQAARRRRGRASSRPTTATSPTGSASAVTTATPATTTPASPASTPACPSSTPRWRSSRSSCSTAPSPGGATWRPATSTACATCPASARRSCR